MKTVREHIRAGTHPSCAKQEQFLAWLDATRGISNGTPKYFCEDCMAQYEQLMTLAGRCDKHASR